MIQSAGNLQVVTVTVALEQSTFGADGVFRNVTTIYYNASIVHRESEIFRGPHYWPDFHGDKKGVFVALSRVLLSKF